MIENHDPGREPKVEFQTRSLAGVCEGRPTMGDKSPKATNKQAAQKQAKANTNTQNKNKAAAAKQAVKGKK